MFRACYQKELKRSPGIGGKIVVKFKIGADGAVVTASPAGGTTLANEAVKDCVARNVNRLKFPPKGAVANVTYPFLFSPGG
jgi:outer membrane biosynthesis protein TonB